MRIFFHIMLLFATNWVLCRVGFVMCQEPNIQELRREVNDLYKDFFETSLILTRGVQDYDAKFDIVKCKSVEFELKLIEFLRAKEAITPEKFLADKPEELPITNLPRELNFNMDGTFDWLEAHGDYTQLKLIIRSQKMNYNPGEPVDIKIFFRNDSDSKIHIGPFWRFDSVTYDGKLFHSNYDEVARTPKSEEKYQKYKQRPFPFPYLAVSSSYFPGLSWTGVRHYTKLKPGQEYELDWVPLNEDFDLTKSDTYELTCFIRTIAPGQYFEPPLQSNTLTFRVLEEPSQEPINARESPNVPYTNPPPGEEVFKQPKPPYNVFYIHTDTKPYIEYLDVSPTEYYRQKLMEQEAQAAKLPDAVKPPAE